MNTDRETSGDGPSSTFGRDARATDFVYQPPAGFIFNRGTRVGTYRRG